MTKSPSILVSVAEFKFEMIGHLPIHELLQFWWKP